MEQQILGARIGVRSAVRRGRRRNAWHRSPRFGQDDDVRLHDQELSELVRQGTTMDRGGCER